LTEKHDSDFDRIETAKQIAYKYHLIIILKSAHTAIVTPNGKVFFNSTGNPGMAKGGSGDVLTGIITGLLARGYEPLESVIIGVFLHGYSADIAIEKMSEESLLANELINQIGTSFFQLENI
ncbi:MAG: NAD(P)H-hydrate dehydratase, partial [Bacteroidota bacterium]